MACMYYAKSEFRAFPEKYCMKRSIMYFQCYVWNCLLFMSGILSLIGKKSSNCSNPWKWISGIEMEVGWWVKWIGNETSLKGHGKEIFQKWVLSLQSPIYGIDYVCRIVKWKSTWVYALIRFESSVEKQQLSILETNKQPSYIHLTE